MVRQPFHHAAAELLQPLHLGPGAKRGRRGCVAQPLHDSGHLDAHLLLVNDGVVPLIQHRQQQLIHDLLHHPAADLLQPLHLGPGGERGGNRGVLHPQQDLFQHSFGRFLIRGHIRPGDEGAGRGGVAEAAHNSGHLDAHILELCGRCIPLVQHRQQQLVDDLLHHAAADLLQPLHLGPGGKRRGDRRVSHAEQDLFQQRLSGLLFVGCIRPGTESARGRRVAEAAQNPSHLHLHLLLLHNRDRPLVENRQQQLVRHLLHHAPANLHQALHLGPGFEGSGDRGIPHPQQNPLEQLFRLQLLHSRLRPGNKSTRSRGIAEAARHLGEDRSMLLRRLQRLSPGDERGSDRSPAEAPNHTLDEVPIAYPLLGRVPPAQECPRQRALEHSRERLSQLCLGLARRGDKRDPRFPREQLRPLHDAAQHTARTPGAVGVQAPGVPSRNHGTHSHPKHHLLHSLGMHLVLLRQSGPRGEGGGQHVLDGAAQALGQQLLDVPELSDDPRPLRKACAQARAHHAREYPVSRGLLLRVHLRHRLVQSLLGAFVLASVDEADPPIPRGGELPLKHAQHEAAHLAHRQHRVHPCVPGFQHRRVLPPQAHPLHNDAHAVLLHQDPLHDLHEPVPCRVQRTLLQPLQHPFAGRLHPPDLPPALVGRGKQPLRQLLQRPDQDAVLALRLRDDGPHLESEGVPRLRQHPRLDPAQHALAQAHARPVLQEPLKSGGQRCVHHLRHRTRQDRRLAIPLELDRTDRVRQAREGSGKRRALDPCQHPPRPPHLAPQVLPRPERPRHARVLHLRRNARHNRLVPFLLILHPEQRVRKRGPRRCQPRLEDLESRPSAHLYLVVVVGPGAPGLGYGGHRDLCRRPLQDRLEPLALVQRAEHVRGEAIPGHAHLPMPHPLHHLDQRTPPPRLLSRRRRKPRERRRQPAVQNLGEDVLELAGGLHGLRPAPKGFLLRGLVLAIVDEHEHHLRLAVLLAVLLGPLLLQLLNVVQHRLLRRLHLLGHPRNHHVRGPQLPPLLLQLRRRLLVALLQQLQLHLNLLHLARRGDLHLLQAARESLLVAAHHLLPCDLGSRQLIDAVLELRVLLGQLALLGRRRGLRLLDGAGLPLLLLRHLRGPLRLAIGVLRPLHAALLRSLVQLSLESLGLGEQLLLPRGGGTLRRFQRVREPLFVRGQLLRPLQIRLLPRLPLIRELRLEAGEAAAQRVGLGGAAPRLGQAVLQLAHLLAQRRRHALVLRLLARQLVLRSLLAFLLGAQLLLECGGVLPLPLEAGALPVQRRQQILRPQPLALALAVFDVQLRLHRQQLPIGRRHGRLRHVVPVVDQVVVDIVEVIVLEPLVDALEVGKDAVALRAVRAAVPPRPRALGRRGVPHAARRGPARCARLVRPVGGLAVAAIEGGRARAGEAAGRARARAGRVRHEGRIRAGAAVQPHAHLLAGDHAIAIRVECRKQHVGGRHRGPPRLLSSNLL